MTTGESEMTLRKEFQELATGVRAVSILLSLVVAIYNALVTVQLHRAADSTYGYLILQADKAPWVVTHAWWLSVSSAVLPVAAGVLGLRLRNHLHALTAVMICLILMIAQMHLVGTALLEPVMQLMNDMGQDDGAVRCGLKMGLGWSQWKGEGASLFLGYLGAFPERAGMLLPLFWTVLGRWKPAISLGPPVPFRPATSVWQGYFHRLECPHDELDAGTTCGGA